MEDDRRRETEDGRQLVLSFEFLVFSCALIGVMTNWKDELRIIRFTVFVLS